MHVRTSYTNKTSKLDASNIYGWSQQGRQPSESTNRRLSLQKKEYEHYQMPPQTLDHQVT